LEEIVRRFLRILRYIANSFLVLSALLMFGLMFGSAFSVPLTIDNQTGRMLLVTPIGTVGKGEKYLLPTLLCPFPAIPGAQNGRFRLAPGASTTILYDMDDINFSEIVVEDEQNEVKQFVADPEPTKNQYHGPSMARYILKDFVSLPAAPPDVLSALRSRRLREANSYNTVLLLIAPWVAALLLEWLVARTDRNRLGSSDAE